ncbi:MAG: right-handed parallel beta-helix repeat-containing protein [Gammaproteobacteria bacterium]
MLTINILLEFEMKRILSCVLMIALSGVALASKTYYVDSLSGNDQWSGALATPQGSPSIDGPWRTISKVNSMPLLPGDAVLFRCGNTWRDQLTVANSGVHGSPVTVGRYGADCDATNKPVISGADVVSGWSRHSGNIYKAKVTNPVQQVFVDGRYVPLAHYPNKTPERSAFLTIAGNSNSQYPGVSGANYLTASAADVSFLSGVDIRNAGIHIRTVNWTIEDNTVTGLSGSVINLQNLSLHAITKGWGYYFDNKFWMLDSPGEWFWNENDDAANGLTAHTLYIRLPDDSDPSSHVIEATVRDKGIYAANDQALHIDNVAVSNVGRYGVYISNPAEFTLTSLDIRNSGETGIFATESDEVNGNLNTQSVRRVENCKISNSVRQAIYLEQIYYVTVTGNSITETGTVGSPVASVAAIYAGQKSRNTVISDNKISGSGYSGIVFGGETRVQNNLVYDSCEVLSDCGAIYTHNGLAASYFNNGVQVKAIPAIKSWVVGNIVNGVRGQGFDGTPQTSRDNNGIYLDNFSNAIEVSGNTVVNSGVGFHSNNAFNNYIHGNTIYGASKMQMDMVEGYDAPFGVVQGLVNGNTTSQHNTVSNNILFPVGNAPGISLTNIPASAVADTFGDFGSNRYSGLYGDRVVRESYLAAYPNRFYFDYKDFTLSEWRAERDQDKNAGFAPPFFIAPYKIDTSIAPIEMLTMTFDSDASPYRVLTSGVGAHVKWQPESGCENSTSGGCMEFVPVDASNTNLVPADTLLDGAGASFGIEKGATYLVKFKLFSKLPHQNLALRIIGSSWADVGFNNTENLLGISDGQIISAGNEWRDYAYVFTASETTRAKVDFWVRLAPGRGPLILIDNLSVQKVKVDFDDPRNDTNIVINDDAVAKAVSCPDITISSPSPTRCGEYVDLNGSPVDWSEPLAPYTSKIVIWNNNPMKYLSNDLSITMKANSAFVQLGGTVTYTVSVTNNGPSPATGIRVIGTLPSCMLNNLAAGATVTCSTYTVVATAIGTITQTMTVSGAETDTTPGNNSATTTVIATSSPPKGIDSLPLPKLADGGNSSSGGNSSGSSSPNGSTAGGGGGVGLEALLFLLVFATRRRAAHRSPTVGRRTS